MLLRELPPEKYWAMPASYNQNKRKDEIDRMIASGDYYCQLKTDGNYSAFICDFDEDKRLISRGVSTVTNEYGRLEDKLFFYESVAAAFSKPTRIMGEIYYDNGIDRNVGSVLRANANKSKSIQDQGYYREISKTVKFSTRDKRDIENNEFKGQKLKWRIFDVWYFDGESLMERPWIERQEYVKMAAERINNPLVSYVRYFPMDETFYDKLGLIFERGGEGVVCYQRNGLPEPGKRTAHKTLKVKQEIADAIDCVITGIEQPTRVYTGKDIESWKFWEDTRTYEKLYGEYFASYQAGHTVEPVTKNYYYGFPGAILTSVYDGQGKLVPLCKVSGLTEEFKAQLRDNFKAWYLCPISITGMMISETNGISVRHPCLKAIRKGDISPQDCSLEKILGGQYGC